MQITGSENRVDRIRLKPGYITRNMTRDLAEVATKLEVAPASVMGISQGGMIAQWLVIDYPEVVERLALVIGGPADRIVGGTEVQQERAGLIDGSRLHVYPGLGHGACAEADDFSDRIVFYPRIDITNKTINNRISAAH